MPWNSPLNLEASNSLARMTARTLSPRRAGSTPRVVAVIEGRSDEGSGSDGAHEEWRLVVKERGGGDDVLRERLERLERRLTLLEGRR